MIALLLGIANSIITSLSNKLKINPQIISLILAVIGAVLYFLWGYYKEEISPEKAKYIVFVIGQIWAYAIAFYEVIIKRVLKINKDIENQ